MTYNDPKGGTQSSIGKQFRTEHMLRKALIEAREKQVFSQLSNTINMPANRGKEIVAFHYLPVLHDANVNDQGIDANGTTATKMATIKFADGENTPLAAQYASGEGTTNAAAINAAKASAITMFKQMGVFDTDYNTTKAALVAAGWIVEGDTAADAVVARGNLYGSSKDVGKIMRGMPELTENGGRVNRIGMKRKTIKGTIKRIGFFINWTDESMWFDTDSKRMMHQNRELLNTAVKTYEDLLQNDLLNAAGVIRYAGDAMNDGTISGETGAITEVTYNDIVRIGIDLDDNDCPKDTKMITGTRLTDTRTIRGARYIYIGSELLPTLYAMKNAHGEAAFIHAHQYTAGGKLANGEVGSIDQFRVIVADNMMRWEGVGATVANNDGFYATTDAAGDEKYDVFPMLVVGSDSFSTIGFQVGPSGKNKFTTYHRKPGAKAVDEMNPYGTKGLSSIQYWYGFLPERGERIALIKTAARW